MTRSPAPGKLIIALPGGDLSGGIALINKSIDLNPNNAAALQIGWRAVCLRR